MSGAVTAGDVDRFNALPRSGAVEQLLACCAVPEWADRLAAGRPYPDLAGLRDAADAALAELDWDGVLRALTAHPRIGERTRGTDREARWSRQEQAAAATPDQSVAEELLAGNLAYEERFGHVFLICATGRSAAEVLAELRSRLHNDVETERAVVREELRRIVALRLGRLVGE
ncbi:OHCU decarboxylase [Longimycelium tulufanense]|uniref:2-oxo-4-hydroxy-4-carboxy-5-ureidoimidazoline decarboxylase n=1 Tax=Longimycelium tulufanense TaxID=907463 RepID=A0A8J3FV46_9PSEU|nr:2-oxo-4-hydroxy-4-carboxy-5-ureidoimidazoline decarboxylase [Longimycelium tulufanense]GGM40935.1 OHCU decarboxylase [Longimycelium tulufanense]